MEATAEAILIADHNEIVTWVNQAFTALTGYAAADIIGRHVSMLALEHVQDARYVDIQRALSADKVWRGELVSRRKDGSLYTEDITITPVLDEAGVVTHHIAIKKDITERKRSEEQRRQQQKLASLGTLARGMAHEINNPLADLPAFSCRQGQIGQVVTALVTNALEAFDPVLPGAMQEERMNGIAERFTWIAHRRCSGLRQGSRARQAAQAKSDNGRGFMWICPQTRDERSRVTPHG